MKRKRKRVITDEEDTNKIIKTRVLMFSERHPGLTLESKNEIVQFHKHYKTLIILDITGSLYSGLLYNGTVTFIPLLSGIRKFISNNNTVVAISGIFIIFFNT